MIDLVTVILLGLGAFRGYRKGLIVAVFSLVAVVLGMIVALKLSHVLAAWLMAQEWVSGTWAPMLAYAVLFIGVAWGVRAGAKAIERATNAVALGLLNRLGGAALYIFLAAVVWSSVLWLASLAGVFSPEAIAKSDTYAYIAPVAPWVAAHIGVVLPFAKSLFADLSGLLDSAAGTPAPPATP